MSDTQQNWFGIASTQDGGGYWVVSSAGAVEGFGDATTYGDMSKATLNKATVGMAPTPGGHGYWLDGGDGGIFSYGDAGFYGSTGSLHLNEPVVGMAPTHDGLGYWMVASDGGVFAYGDAPFEGSMGATHLNKPIVGMAPTHDGRGYWMVASDGGIFAFGDAQFEGSLGGSPPTSPIAYMAPTPDNNGYWLVSQSGTVYPFGDASQYGSVTGSAAPATSLAGLSGGYWVLTADGAVHPFGSAQNYGSPLTGPVTPHASASTPAASAPVSLSGSPPASGSSGNSGTSPVSISRLTPAGGTAGGGATITITGSDFTGAKAVDFGDNASSAFSVTSPTSISAVAPVGAGTVNVQVVTPEGTSSSSSATQFTYVPTGQLPITAQGQHLEVGGVPTLFTGFNAYQLATDWGTNAGCGGTATTAQIDSFFASLRPNSLVRFWAFQGTLATNFRSGQLDWAPLDNIFAQAAKYHVYLIPTISDQGGTCDGDHWQDPAWYSGGFMNVYNASSNSDGRGLTPLSYWTYMDDLVSRYADSPALGMWEPMSEAEASTCPAADQPGNCSGHQTCPSETAAATALTSFFTTVGAEIHHLDPTHLVEGGFLGGGQCGTSGADYQRVGASPGIDVLSVHDYYGTAAMGGDQWNGMAVRFGQARALDKPIITGEAGIQAGNGQAGCISLQQRATAMSAKMHAQFAAGDSAFLVWDWLLDPLGPCSYNTGPIDSPLAAAIATTPTT
ncbi:MAG TPA: IPT/TIG domain-containing protein [Acidimicrobiales bacterium]|nr:IPT/TIG domain-containing protein [Acidimicrobiales bacterium]